MENSTIHLGSIVSRPDAAQQCFWAHLAFRPMARNRGGKLWLLGGGTVQFKLA
jgi:hypothetical protein